MALNSPLTVLVFALFALLSGMGVGSAGLPVLYLTWVLRYPQFEAQGLNLLCFIAAAGASLTVHLRRTPPLYAVALLLLAAGLPGAWFGTRLTAVLPAVWLRRLFGAFLVLTGLVGLLAPKRTDKSQKKNAF